MGLVLANFIRLPLRREDPEPQGLFDIHNANYGWWQNDSGDNVLTVEKLRTAMKAATVNRDLEYQQWLEFYQGKKWRIR